MSKLKPIFLLFVFTIFLINPTIYQAQEKTNLLSLDSIYYNNREYTIHQNIELELGETYTFYFSKEIYGENLSYLTGLGVGIKIFFDDDMINSNEIVDATEGHYLEFTAKGDINKIVIKTSNPEIIEYPLFSLYLGDHTLFKGFVKGIVNNPDKSIYLARRGVLKSIEEIYSEILIDTDFTNVKVEIKKDEYTSNYNKYGLYDVDLEIYDCHNNFLTPLIIQVKVVNKIMSYIDGPDEVTLYRGPSVNLYSIFENEQFKLITDNGASTALHIDAPDFNLNYDGTYEARIYGYDQFENFIYKDILIHLVDNTAPTISKQTQIIFIYNDVEPLSIETIKNQFTIKDDGPIDQLTITFENYTEYLESSETPGDYNIIINVKDRSNNTSNDEIVIRVITRKTLIITPDIRFFLDLTTASEMTLQQIEDWFLNQLIQNNIEATNLELVFSDYQLNSKPGQYHIDFTYLANNQLYRERIAINIEDSSTTLKPPHIILIAVSSLVIVLAPLFFIYKKKLKLKKIKK